MANWKHNDGMHLTVRPGTPLAVSAPPHITSQGGAQGARRSWPAGDAGRSTDRENDGRDLISGCRIARGSAGRRSLTAVVEVVTVPMSFVEQGGLLSATSGRFLPHGGRRQSALCHAPRSVDSRASIGGWNLRRFRGAFVATSVSRDRGCALATDHSRQGVAVHFRFTSDLLFSITFRRDCIHVTRRVSRGVRRVHARSPLRSAVPIQHLRLACSLRSWKPARATGTIIEQPSNKPVNLSVRPVPGLACASPAPARPAGYRRRYTHRMVIP